MNKVKIELKQLPPKELEERIKALRLDYLALRLNVATARIKDYSQFKKLRKNIACALTLLTEKRRQQ